MEKTPELVAAEAAKYAAEFEEKIHRLRDAWEVLRPFIPNQHHQSMADVGLALSRRLEQVKAAAFDAWRLAQAEPKEAKHGS